MILIGAFTKKVDSGLEGMMPKNEIRGWAKWTVGALGILTAGYFANHYTGDKTGIEKLVTGKSSYAAQGAGANLKTRIPTGYDIKAELLKQKLYFVLLDRNGTIIPAAAQLKEPVITDNTYTAVEKFYRVTLDDSYKIKLTEFDEAFLKELDEGKIKIATGYLVAPKTGTAQPSGPNPLQSMQRILR